MQQKLGVVCACVRKDNTTDTNKFHTVHLLSPLSAHAVAHHELDEPLYCLRLYYLGHL